MDISRTSAQRISRQDLGCFPSKKTKQPKLTDLQKKKTKFANWVLSNSIKKDTKNWLSTDKNYFTLDDVYNVQNDRIWTVSREEADKQVAMHQKTKFSRKMKVWLGVCAEGLTAPVIFEDGTMDAKKHKGSSSSST